jgi:tRNA_anti-like
MTNWKKMILGFTLISMAGAGYGFYLYKKKPADIRKEAARFEISAAALVADFNADETIANQKYTDKVIAVKGKVAEVKIDSAGQATVFLDSGDPLAAVTCSFYREEAAAAGKLRQGTDIVIKGKCTGKLMDVVLNKCSINQ